jgi:hypothetical protein
MRGNVLSGIAKVFTMIVICLLFGATAFAEKTAPTEMIRYNKLRKFQNL